MTSTRLDATGLGPVVAICLTAVALTAWQVRVDRSVFERFLGVVDPTLAMVAASVVGLVSMAHVQATSELAAVGPGTARGAIAVITWWVPLFALAAIVADIVLRYPEDANVALPDAVRFYPAIAVFVELVLHVVPVTALVAVLGPPTDATFWRIAVPVALIEAALQAAYATTIGTALFSAVQLTLFGIVQVWVFWRYGFVWMLGFRLAYYALWHVAWGAARAELLF